MQGFLIHILSNHTPCVTGRMGGIVHSMQLLQDISGCSVIGLIAHTKYEVTTNTLMI